MCIRISVLSPRYSTSSRTEKIRRLSKVCAPTATTAMTATAIPRCGKSKPFSASWKGKDDRPTDGKEESATGNHVETLSFLEDFFKTLFHVRATALFSRLSRASRFCRLNKKYNTELLTRRTRHRRIALILSLRSISSLSLSRSLQQLRHSFALATLGTRRVVRGE